jgi:hypothetical protein
MPQWEYSTLTVRGGLPVSIEYSAGNTVLLGLISLQQFLAEIGQSGWEAIETPGDKDNYRILFKRPVAAPHPAS